MIEDGSSRPFTETSQRVYFDVIARPDAPVAQLTIPDGVIYAGADLAVSYETGSATTNGDRIALYLDVTPQMNYDTYHDIADVVDSGAMELVTGTVILHPRSAGVYYVVMLGEGNFLELTERVRVVVELYSGETETSYELNSRQLTVTAGPHYRDEDISISFEGATNSLDWIGMYAEGDEGWNFHAQSHYLHAAEGTGTVTLTPTAAGTYYAVLLCCNGILEISPRVTVTVLDPVGTAAREAGRGVIQITDAAVHYVNMPVPLDFTGAPSVNSVIVMLPGAWNNRG